ncbi:MAG: hydrogenase maturation protease [Candidatus Omnitrophica bacterium]|nr:hydrogenase maturation protease [Candidatus Omnitrophota bacterium]
MKPILIIGYGNRLCGDDGVGPAVVKALEARYAGDVAVSLLARHQLTPELVDFIVGKDLVIFIDATLEGAPGEITERKVNQEAEVATLSHTCTPTNLLVAARVLFGSHVSGVVVTVAGESFEVGEGLSAKVRNALPGLVERILGIVEERRTGARVLHR